MARPSNVRLLRINDETFAPFLSGNETVVPDLPDDLTLIDMFHDHLRDCFYLKVQSDEFSPVKEGEKIPEMGVEWERAIPISDERLEEAFDVAAELSFTPEP